MSGPRPVVIDGTVYVPAGDNPDGLADWFPLLAEEDLAE